jgi:prefoldin alpha subunit
MNMAAGPQQRIVITREDLERMIEERNALAALVEGLRQNLTIVMETVNELRSAKEVLGIMNRGNMGETYTEVGGGVFVKASPVLGERVLVNVGANYVVEMEIPSAINYIEARVKEVEEVRSRLESQLSDVSKRLGEIEQFLLYVATAMRQRQGQGNVR